MRRHRLRIETETQPAHSLQQKLGVVFLYLMFVSLATQIGKARDDPPSSRKQSRPVKIIARPTMCCSKIIVTHAPYLWRNGRNVEGSPWRLALAGTPSGFLCMETKPNTQAQVCDENRQDDQPECQGVEHGRTGYPFAHFPLLGKVLVGAGVLLKVELMTTRGAAFTELMRCAWALVFVTGGIKLATMQNRLRIPITIRTPLKASLVFILYRHRWRHFRAIQLAAQPLINRSS
jgi:hypothetical protein